MIKERFGKWTKWYWFLVLIYVLVIASYLFFNGFGDKEGYEILPLVILVIFSVTIWGGLGFAILSILVYIILKIADKK